MSDEARLKVILADYQSGKLDEAESALATYSVAHPNDMQALHLAAMVAARRGDYPLAMTRIRASLRDGRKAHEKLNVQGNILRALGLDVDAQTSFEAALEAEPGFRPARRNLASLMLATSQPLEAARHLRRLREQEGDGTNPGDLQVARAEVEALIEGGQLEKAESLITKLGLPAPAEAALRMRIHVYQERYEDVLGEHVVATADEMSGARAFQTALQTLHMTGGWGMAEDLIEDTLSRHPARGDLWAVGLRALHSAGDSRAALQLYGRAPRTVDTVVARAEIANDQGNFADAEQLALQALDMQRAHPPAMNALCLASLGLGAEDPAKLNQAQNVADLGLQADPNNQFYYAVKATAGRAKGQDYKYYFNTDFVRSYDLDPPAGWDNIDAFNSDLAAELDALHGFEGAPLDQTLRLGTQTAPDLRFVDSPAIRGFFEAVEPAISNYLSGLERNPRHAFLRRNIGGHRVRSAWSVRLGGGGHHVNHIHPEGWISSSYYVRVPKTKGEEGWITFGQPPAVIADALGQGPEHSVKPVAGRLVLFPSYLWHGVNSVADVERLEKRMTLPIDILPAKPPVEVGGT